MRAPVTSTERGRFSFVRPRDARRAVKAGFHTHLAKPAEPSMLTAVVATLAGRVT
jgi:hypothetical protein